MPSEKEIEAGAEAIYKTMPLSTEIKVPTTHLNPPYESKEYIFSWEECKREDKEHTARIYHKAKVALEAAEKVRWQPIETAPKDGTTIILYNKFYSYLPIGKWDILEGGDEYGNNAIYAWHVSENFNTMGDGILSENEDIMPTHWIPLPEIE